VCVFKCYIKLEIKRLDLNLFKNHDQYDAASSKGQGGEEMRAWYFSSIRKKKIFIFFPIHALHSYNEHMANHMQILKGILVS